MQQRRFISTALVFIMLVAPLSGATESIRNPFVGTYTRTYMGATRQIKETLVLRRNMTCTLTTSFPTSTYFKPWTRKGTWTVDANSAQITWKIDEETEKMKFVLKGSSLVATEYNAETWGAELQYERVKSR